MTAARSSGSQRQLADLGMQRLHVDGRRGGCHASRSENLGSSALELRLPRRNLIGMDVKLLGQLSYRSVALLYYSRDCRRAGHAMPAPTGGGRLT